MKKYLLLFAVILFCLSLVGKLDAQESCPVPEEARPYIETAIFNFLLDSIYVGESTHIDPQGLLAKAFIPYSSTLLGTVRSSGTPSDPGVRVQQSLLELCSGPRVFERVCNSEQPETPSDGFWKDHDACINLSCLARGVYQTEIVWIEKDASADEPHSFRYKTVRGEEIRYDPNPTTVWRVDATNRKKLVVTGDSFAVVKVITRNGRSLDLTHKGSVTTTNREEGLSSIIFNIVFPSLRTTAPIRAQLLLHRHTEAFAAGEIAVGDNVVAGLRLDPGQPLKIEWIPACR